MKKAGIILPVLGAAVGFAAGVISYVPRRVDDRAATRSEITNTSFSPSESTPPLGQGSDSEIFGLLFQSNRLRGMAELGAALDRVDSSQIGALLERLDRPAVENRAALMHRLMSYWARRDPEAATAWMQPRLALLYWDRLRFSVRLEHLIDDGDGSLIQAWAQNVPEAAIECARQHPDAGVSGAILASVIDGPQVQSDAERFALLSSFPGKRQRERVMEYFIAGFQTRAEADYETAERGVLSLPAGLERDRAMEGILAHWKGADPAAALARFRSLGVDFSSLVPILTHHGAKQNPEQVAHWLERLEPAELARCGGVLVTSWAMSDPLAAFAWAENHGVSLTKNSRIESVAVDSGQWWDSHREMGRTPLEAAIAEKPEATIEWLRALGPGPERTRLIELAALAADKNADIESLVADLPEGAAGRVVTRVTMSMRDDQERVQRWAGDLPAGPARDAAWRSVGLFAKSPTLSLPSGPDRDAMFDGVAQRHRNDVAQGWRYLQQIDDPDRRRQAFDDMIRDIRPSQDYWIPDDKSVPIFREWMENPEIPEEWKKPWRTYDRSNN